MFILEITGRTVEGTAPAASEPTSTRGGRRAPGTGGSGNGAGEGTTDTFEVSGVKTVLGGTNTAILSRGLIRRVAASGSVAGRFGASSVGAIPMIGAIASIGYTAWDGLKACFMDSGEEKDKAFTEFGLKAGVLIAGAAIACLFVPVAGIGAAILTGVSIAGGANMLADCLGGWNNLVGKIFPRFRFGL